MGSEPDDDSNKAGPQRRAIRRRVTRVVGLQERGIMKQFVAVIGNRNSGKSTVIKSLTGCSSSSYRGFVHGLSFERVPSQSRTKEATPKHSGNCFSIKASLCEAKGLGRASLLTYQCNHHQQKDSHCKLNQWLSIYDNKSAPKGL